MKDLKLWIAVVLSGMIAGSTLAAAENWDSPRKGPAHLSQQKSPVDAQDERPGLFRPDRRQQAGTVDSSSAKQEDEALKQAIKRNEKRFPIEPPTAEPGRDR